jgi:hypothetical protein
MDEVTMRLPDEPHNVKREARRVQWEEASRDPMFLRDLEETAVAFASADAEMSHAAHCRER